MTLAQPVRCAAGSGGSPSRFPPEALVGDRQPLLPEPVHRLVTTRAIVVTGRVQLGKLAPHRGRSGQTPVQSVRLKSAVQLVSQVWPPSSENACSHRAVVAVMSDHL